MTTKHSDTETPEHTSLPEAEALVEHVTRRVLIEQFPAWELREFGEFVDPADVLDRLRLHNARRVA